MEQQHHGDHVTGTTTTSTPSTHAHATEHTTARDGHTSSTSNGRVDLGQICGMCHAPITQPLGRGGVRRWCSDACRQKAHRQRLAVRLKRLAALEGVPPTGSRLTGSQIPQNPRTHAELTRTRHQTNQNHPSRPHRRDETTKPPSVPGSTLQPLRKPARAPKGATRPKAVFLSTLRPRRPTPTMRPPPVEAWTVTQSP